MLIPTSSKFIPLIKTVNALRTIERSNVGSSENFAGLRLPTVAYLRLLGSAKADVARLRGQQPRVQTAQLEPWLDDLKLPQAPAEICKLGFSKQLHHFIIEVAENPAALQDQSTQGILRSTRRWIKNLRTSYYLLSKNHLPPKELDELCTHMGKVNDMLLAKVADRALCAETRALSAMVRKVAQGKPWQTFAQSKPKDILKRFNQHGKCVHDTLPRLGRPIELGKFHTIRKKVDEVMVLYRMIGALHNDPETQVTFKKLYALVWSMGNIHDHWVQKVHLGQHSPEKVKIHITHAMHNKLAQFSEDLISTKAKS